MIRSPRESDFPTKQEGHSSDEKEKASSSSTQLLRLKDPRIVRVSRAFGGKDRHSKVCTIRGLRDRRVRLSVPTAIQLYDLQDRLGFNQPSKVIDWLLNAAKHEIDGLPPLPVSPLNFSLISNHPSAIIASNHLRPSQFNEERFNVNQNIQLEAPNSGNDFWKLKTKEAAEEMISEKPNWTDRNDEVKQGSNNECGEQVLPNNLLPRSNHPSFLGLMNSMPLGYQWEPSGDADVSQSGNHGFTNQTDIHSNIIPSSSTLSLSTGNSQILLCPPGATQSHFSPQVTAMEMDPRQIHHYQMFSSSSQNLMTNSLSPSPYSMSQSFRPFGLSMMTPKLHSPNSRESHSRKDRDFLSK